MVAGRTRIPRVRPQRVARRTRPDDCTRLEPALDRCVGEQAVHLSESFPTARVRRRRRHSVGETSGTFSDTGPRVHTREKSGEKW